MSALKALKNLWFLIFAAEVLFGDAPFDGSRVSPGMLGPGAERHPGNFRETSCCIVADVKGV